MHPLDTHGRAGELGQDALQGVKVTRDRAVNATRSLAPALGDGDHGGIFVDIQARLVIAVHVLVPFLVGLVVTRISTTRLRLCASPRNPRFEDKHTVLDSAAFCTQL
jgi:hypothetical protein